MSFLLALLAVQVGPFSTPGAQPVSPLPPEVVEQKARERKKRQEEASSAPATSPRPTISATLAQCLAGVEADPTEAAQAAEAWQQKTKGAERAEAGQCLGLALTRLGRWDEAEQAFMAARDAAPQDDHASRARLGSMAGNAALATGNAEGALTVLNDAHGDAQAAGEAVLAGDIAIDRARALVTLGRLEEAAPALAEARTARPGDAQAWLLSATLSRRMGHLADAQQQIEKAAELLPVDPEIGLEAGRIAALAGKDDAARKSWQSVIDAAPKSDSATQARDYLAQLGTLQKP